MRVKKDIGVGLIIFILNEKITGGLLIMRKKSTTFVILKIGCTVLVTSLFQHFLNLFN